MATGWYTWDRKNNVCFVLCILFLNCNKPKTETATENLMYQNTLNNGVLVCRLGTGYFSEYFKNYASKEKKYSHIGMVAKENDTLFVYHCEASELTGVGFVKREQLSSFLKGIKVFDFFDFNYTDSIKNQVLNNVKYYYKHKTPFDLEFDSFNDDKVYCTELIAISINKIFEEVVIYPSLNLNGKQLYALDDIYLNENVKLIKHTH